MPAIVFHGWTHATHPYCGRVTGEKQWSPGRYQVESADDALVLVRDFATDGPNGGPAFEIPADEPATPHESADAPTPTPRKRR